MPRAMVLDRLERVVIPEALKPWWGEVEEGAGGWLTADWFGTFKYYELGWLYHARLGWLYSSPAKENSVWLWREDPGLVLDQRGSLALPVVRSFWELVISCTKASQENRSGFTIILRILSLNEFSLYLGWIRFD